MSVPKRAGQLLCAGITARALPVSKRVLDLLLGSSMLLVSLPLWLLIAIAIKLDSPGSVFYAHDDAGLRTLRVGCGGRLFWFVKFRTMRPGTDRQRWRLPNARAGPLVKIADDPRVTRVGRWLRRTSLDELPNLLAVLAGDMSLVGPRPHVPEEVSRYPRAARDVLTVHPGLTGLPQVSGRSDLSFAQEIALDRQYIARRSVWLDLCIIARTAAVVLLPGHRE